MCTIQHCSRHNHLPSGTPRVPFSTVRGTITCRVVRYVYHSAPSEAQSPGEWYITCTIQHRPRHNHLVSGTPRVPFSTVRGTITCRVVRHVYHSAPSEAQSPGEWYITCTIQHRPRHNHWWVVRHLYQGALVEPRFAGWLSGKPGVGILGGY